MFKSTFANALSVFMTGALALAGVEGKPAIGMGGEAGRMDPWLEDFVTRRGQGPRVHPRGRPLLPRRHRR